MTYVRLVEAWWHADDCDTAIETLRHGLGKHGLEAALPSELLRERTRSATVNNDEDEADLRRHQIGIVAVHANLELERRGDVRRFRSFGVALRDETDEPAWILVTPVEHTELLAIGGPPSALEIPYDDARSIDDLPQIVLQQPVRLEDLDDDRAQLLSNTAFRTGNYAEVVRLAPVAMSQGGHGLLAQLQYLDALRRLGRIEDARAAWIRIADAWLSATYTVWDTQWKKLAALHDELGLSDARLGQVKSRI